MNKPFHESYHDAFRKTALSLPGVTEATSYGTPSFKVKNKMLARFHQDGVSLVLKMEPDVRDFLMQQSPETYYITNHYRNYPYVLVNLRTADPDALKGHLLAVWKSLAPKRLLERFL